MKLDEKRGEFDNAITFLKNNLSHITTGRADPSLLEDVTVTVYETSMKLNELASIAVPEPRVLLIEPWDRNVIKEIGNALKNSKLDGQIQMSGDSIKFIIPHMIEENRKAYIKKVKEKIEQARVTVRRVRDKLKDGINQEEKDKVISEDEKFTTLKQLDELTNEYTSKIKDIGEQKEKEILTI